MSHYSRSLRRSRRELLRLSAGASIAALLAACGGKSATDSAAGDTAATDTGVGDTASANTGTADGAATSTSTAGASETAASASNTVTTAAAQPPRRRGPPEEADAPRTAPSGVVSTTTVPSGATLDAALQLRVVFTYLPTGGGRVLNPYIAVWIEDANGLLLRTIGLSLQQGKGSKWWPDLRRWWRSDSARIAAGGTENVATIVSATRQPGVHEFTWDGTNEVGQRLGVGNYKLFIEAAREKGPYDLVEHDLKLDNKAMSATLAPSGELQEINVAVERV
jgi:hypothetical protein